VVHILIYINFDSSILDLTLFTYLRKKHLPLLPPPWLRIFANNHLSRNLPNSVRSEIDESD
jgi:hypothetical protein